MEHIAMKARHQSAVRWVLMASALAVAFAGCSSSASTSTLGIPTVSGASGRSGAIPAFYVPPRPLPAAPAGTLIRAERVIGVPGVPAGATAWRILFHSRSIYGADLAESGYVIAPGSPVPAGGYPVIAWAHGTTGFSATCAPSLFADGGGGTGPYLLPGLDQFLHAGFAVAAADYQGLGVSDDVHPYLLGSSEGQAVLDATRAARDLPNLHTANTVVIYGHSQGGHAALFAGEMAPTYAPDLHVVGVVAAAPATGLSTLISIVGTPLGQDFLPFSIPAAYSWTRAYRDLPVTDVFTPAGERFASSTVITGCLPALAAAITAEKVTPASMFQSSASTNPVLVAHAKLNDPGQVRTSVPVLVVQGTADTTVPPPLTDSFVTTKACPIGDTIDYLRVTGATHSTVVFVAVPAILQWMKGRLVGQPAPATCGQPGSAGHLSP